MTLTYRPVAKLRNFRQDFHHLASIHTSSSVAAALSQLELNIDSPSDPDPPASEALPVSCLLTVSDWLRDPTTYLNDPELTSSLANLLIRAYFHFLSDLDVLHALDKCTKALCSRSQLARQTFQGSTLLPVCVDRLRKSPHGQMADPGAVRVVRTFLRLLFQDAPLDPDDIQAILGALVIGSRLSSDHAEGLALALPAFINRSEAPHFEDEILSLMASLLLDASDVTLPRLISCAEQLIRRDMRLFHDLVDREILPELVAQVQSLAADAPFRVLPAMIHLLDCLRQRLRRDEVEAIALLIDRNLYYASLRCYDPRDLGECLDIIARVLDPDLANLDMFKAALEDLLANSSFAIQTECLEFLFRGTRDEIPEFFDLALSLNIVVRYASYLEPAVAHSEVYLALLLSMSSPPACISWEARTHLLMAFFCNYTDDVEVPEGGQGFSEQENSVMWRIRAILDTFSADSEHEENPLRFQSEISGAVVNLTDQAAAIVANLTMLNSTYDDFRPAELA
jgi:hypothetical protein